MVERGGGRGERIRGLARWRGMGAKNLGYVLEGSSSTFVLVSEMETADWISGREAEEGSLASVSEALETLDPRP